MSKTMSVKEVVRYLNFLLRNSGAWEHLDDSCLYDDALNAAIKILQAVDEANGMLPDKKPDKAKFCYDDYEDICLCLDDEDGSKQSKNDCRHLSSGKNKEDCQSYRYGSTGEEERNETIDEVTPIFAKLIAENKEKDERISQLEQQLNTLKIENSKTGNQCVHYSKCHGEIKQKLEQLHSKFGMSLDDAMKFNGDNI